MLIPELNPRITRQIRFLRLRPRSCVTLAGAKSASLGIISGRKKAKGAEEYLRLWSFHLHKVLFLIVLYSIDMHIFQHHCNSYPMLKNVIVATYIWRYFNELLINMLLLSSTRTWTTLSRADVEILASCIWTSETIFSLLCFCFFPQFSLVHIESAYKLSIKAKQINPNIVKSKKLIYSLERSIIADLFPLFCYLQVG